MKKLRVAIQISTVSLSVLVVAGVAMAILSPSSFSDSAFDIIAFSVSAASLAVAILSQVSAYHDRKSLSKMIHEINELNAETEDEKQNNTKLQQKLDELISLDRRIYRKISKQKGKK